MRMKWSEWHGLHIGFTYGMYSDGMRSLYPVLKCEVKLPEPWQRAVGVVTVSQALVAQSPDRIPIFHLEALRTALLAAAQNYVGAKVASVEATRSPVPPRELQFADPKHWPVIT